MRHFTALLFILICSVMTAIAQTPGFTVGKQYFPTDTFSDKYCYGYDVVYTDGRPPDHFPRQKLPVTADAEFEAGTGFHSHETDPTTASPRPPGTWIQGPTVSTGPDGCSVFYWQNNGYSGWVDFTFTAPGYPAYKKAHYFGYQERNFFGFKADLVNFSGTNFVQPLSLHTDTRHKDSFGNSGYSRYLSRKANAAFVTIASTWVGVSPTPAPLDFYRCSLKNGGKADNEFIAGTNIYLFNPWIVHSGAENSQGNECDIGNPSGNVGQTGDPSLFLRLETFATLASCRLGQVDLLAGGFADADQYWAFQAIVHVDCAPKIPTGKKGN